MAGQSVEVLVDGGKASAGPPLGPALGPLGVNVMNVVKAINEKTADFAGMKVPVKVVVDPKTKSFEISVGTPPTSQLLFTELGIEKGSGKPKSDKVGNLTIAQVIKVSRMKADSLNGANLKKRVKEVAGTANSCGMTVEGLDARAFQAAVEAGQFDAQLQ
jgi:large subunit ribosomal protein L11